MTTNPYNSAWRLFRSYAASKGYTEKVVGDEAFARSRRPDARRIRLLHAFPRQQKIVVQEDGAPSYDLPWTPPQSENGE